MSQIEPKYSGFRPFMGHSQIITRYSPRYSTRGHSTSILQIYDSALTQLRLQSFDIRLDDVPRVGTPLRRYLVLIECYYGLEWAYNKIQALKTFVGRRGPVELYVINFTKRRQGTKYLYNLFVLYKIVICKKKKGSDWGHIKKSLEKHSKTGHYSPVFEQSVVQMICLQP